MPTNDETIRAALARAAIAARISGTIEHNPESGEHYVVREGDEAWRPFTNKADAMGLVLQLRLDVLFNAGDSGAIIFPPNADEPVQVHDARNAGELLAGIVLAAAALA
jgi:hypothetical protein